MDNLTFFGIVIAVIVFTGVVTNLGKPQIPTKPQPPRKPLPMSARVDNMPITADTLADDYILNHVMGKTPVTDTFHSFIRTNERYKAKLQSLKVIPESSTFLYEFADLSLLEVVEDKKSKTYSFNLRKRK